MKITPLLNYGLVLMFFQPILIQAADPGVVQKAEDPLTRSAHTPVDITTMSGITYPGSTITRVEPDGISISYYKGIIKIPFEDLPKEFQRRYDYNPSNAAAYTQFVIRKQAEERQAAEAAAAAKARETFPPPAGDAAPEPPWANETPRGQALIAAQTVHEMVQKLGESPEEFQARQRAAIDEAIRQSGQTPIADVDRMVKDGKVEVISPAPDLVAAEAVQNMVQQLGESPEQFQARKRAARRAVEAAVESVQP